MIQSVWWLWTVRGPSVINTSNLSQLRFHGYVCHSDDCVGIFKSEYCYWGPSQAVQDGKLVVNCMALKNSMLSKMRFFSKVMFKLYLKRFFSWFICPKWHFFSYSHEFCTKIHVRKQIWISIKFGKFLQKNECPKSPPG